MNRNVLAFAALAVGVASISTVSLAGSPADTISARHDNFKVMGKAFKGILDQTKAPAPDIAAIQSSATALAGAASKVGGLFPKGSGPESGAKTHALPVIWEKPGDFDMAVTKLVNGSKAMQTAAASGNIDQIKAAIPGVGGSCKGCHEQFKARD